MYMYCSTTMYCKVAGSNLTCRDDSKARWRLHSVDSTSTELFLLGQDIIHLPVAIEFCVDDEHLHTSSKNARIDGKRGYLCNIVSQRRSQ